MPVYNNPTQPIVFEKNLLAGTHVIYVCPQNRAASINSIRITTAAGNTITLTVSRVQPPGTYNAYVFNLSAGDSMLDSTSYVFREGDSISITLTAAATVMAYGQVFKTGQTVF